MGTATLTRHRSARVCQAHQHVPSQSASRTTAPKLAKACGVDPAEFMKLCLSEYQPAVLEALSESFSAVVDEDEMKLLRSIRTAKNSTEEKEQMEARQQARTEYEIKRANIIRINYDTDTAALKKLEDFTKKNLLT